MKENSALSISEAPWWGPALWVQCPAFPCSCRLCPGCLFVAMGWSMAGRGDVLVESVLPGAGQGLSLLCLALPEILLSFSGTDLTNRALSSRHSCLGTVRGRCIFGINAAVINCTDKTKVREAAVALPFCCLVLCEMDVLHNMVQMQEH